ncbi:autotransporter outer membrane beta-barrel domain-containing protein, partial [uncultured Deefgea sp.]|uniref:autotransporter outer membrane beta-barrel domain-containing protein n=1 Tax=uncultured Deefgea sp. TaxID=1304914 RepID=UPI002618BDD0
PELPMGVKPPIGTLPAKPPVTGITPELPAGAKPPIGTLPPEPPTGSEIVAATALPASRELAVLTPCPMQQDPATIVDKNALTDVNCMGMQLEGNNSSNLTAIPSTEGREFGLETLWNTWADSNYVDIRDRRHDMDLSGHSASVALGFDRRLDGGLIAGMSLSLENNKSSAFANDMRNSSNGFNIGPYIAYPYSENWVFDGSLTFSHMNNQQHLLILDGDYSSQRYAISARANGQFPLGEALIRPKIGVYYAHNRSEAYALNGMIAGYALRLENEKSSVNTGSIDSAIEITQTFYTQNGTPWMPYAELLLGYEFARVNDGKILTGDLSLLDSSPWQGGVKVGVRSLLGRSSSIDASAGYLSLGQKDLNIWELRLFLSHAF